MAEDREYTTYSEHLDHGSRLKGQPVAATKPWYKNVWIMFSIGIALAALIAVFSFQMIGAVEELGQSIDEQTVEMKDSNQLLEVQNNIIQGMEAGIVYIGQKISEWVLMIHHELQEFQATREQQ